MKLKQILASAAAVIVVAAVAAYLLKLTGSGPITLDDAGYAQAVQWNNGCLILPNDATHVHAYERTGGGTFLIRNCRFTVAPSRVEAAVDEIIAIDKKRLGKEVTFKKADIAASKRHLQPNDNSLRWWEPDKITRGFYAGSDDVYAAHIWADTATGNVYVYSTD